MRVFAPVAFLLGTFSLAVAQSPAPDKIFSDPSAANGLVRKANDLLDAQDYVGTLKTLEQALALCPNNARLQLDSALRKHAAHDYAGAQVDIVQAARGYPELGRIFFLSGYARLESKDYYGAIQDLSLSIYINPRQYLQFLPRGQARFQIGDYQGAIEDFTVQIQSPQQTTIQLVYLERGKARYEIGDGEGALADLTSVIRLDKANFASAYAYRSWQQTRNGNLTAALCDCNEAFRVNPRAPLILAYRSWLQHELGNPDAARRDADATIALIPALPFGWMYRGVLNEMEDQPEAAANDYRKAISLAEEKSQRDTWIYACFCLDILNRQTGRASYKDYLKDVFDWHDDWAKRVALYLAGKTSDDSLERDARNTKDARVRPHQECEAYYYIGVMHLIDGERDIASDYFKRTIATGQVTLIEYRLAREHLKRLQNKPPETKSTQ